MKKGIFPAEEVHMCIFYAQAHNLQYKFIDVDTKELNKLWKSIPILIRGFFAIFLSMICIITLIVPSILYKLSSKILNIFRKNKNSSKRNRKLVDVGFSKGFDSKLLDYRNEYMVNNLKILNKKYGNIVLCVGDKHVSGISRLLEKDGIEHRSTRFKELTTT